MSSRIENDPVRRYCENEHELDSSKNVSECVVKTTVTQSSAAPLPKTERNEIQENWQYKSNDEPEKPGHQIETNLNTQLRHLPVGGKLEVAAEGKVEIEGIGIIAKGSAELERREDGRPQLTVAIGAGVEVSESAGFAEAGVSAVLNLKKSTPFESDPEAADCTSALAQSGMDEFGLNPFTERSAPDRAEAMLKRPGTFTAELEGELFGKIKGGAGLAQLQLDGKAVGRSRLSLNEISGKVTVEQDYELSVRAAASLGIHAGVFKAAGSSEIANVSVGHTVKHTLQLTPEQVRQMTRSGSFGDAALAMLTKMPETEIIQKMSGTVDGYSFKGERKLPMDRTMTAGKYLDVPDMDVEVRSGSWKQSIEVEVKAHVAEGKVTMTSTNPGALVTKSTVADLFSGGVKHNNVTQLEALRAQSNISR